MTKVYIKTLGCEKNTVDSEYAAGILVNAGCKIVDSADKADVLLVNTCSFINDAKEQSISDIFELAQVKGNKKLIVSGCLSQRYSKELVKVMPEVDHFIGVNDYEKIADLVLGTDDTKAYANQCEKVYKELGDRYLTTNKWSRSIKIAEGCNNICSYCAIPFIRGKYRSRKPEDILEEAKTLAEEGCKELVVIAQDVTFYGKDFKKKDMLPKLLHDLCKIEGIDWIRLMYCYEDEITDELINTIKNEDKIVKYIDIPIQHCSTKILKAMNRKSTKTSIIKTIERLRKQIPGIVIRTTLITGFPGETKEDFNELYNFVKETKFDRLGVFAYSKEENTKAAKMPGQVRQDVKERRRDKIMELQRRISLENNQKYIGQIVNVIVEEIDEEGAYIGRCSFDAEGIDNGIIFTSKKKHKKGDFVKVLVNDAFDYDLSGEEMK